MRHAISSNVATATFMAMLKPSKVKLTGRSRLECWERNPGPSLSIMSTVVWTATDPKRKGRWVVGWYRDARVYRNRENFDGSPSTQHRLEGNKESIRIRTRARNAVLVPLKQRDIPLGRGKGVDRPSELVVSRKAIERRDQAFRRTKCANGLLSGISLVVT